MPFSPEQNLLAKPHLYINKKNASESQKELSYATS
jgi:hypothetical protein